jgi:hypothetical protein
MAMTRRAWLASACAMVAGGAWAQETGGGAPQAPALQEPAPPPTDPLFAALRSEARALESLVLQSQGVPFVMDPEDTLVVLSGILELSISQSQSGRVLGVCMGRLDGVFDALSGDMTVQAHSFVGADARRESGVLVGMDVPLSGFASTGEQGAPQAWLEAKNVTVGERPRGGRALWRAEGRMLGTKPGRVVVGPINGHWTPLVGGRLVVQGAWAMRENTRP